VQRQALQSAIARARSDAEAMAESAGGRLGELVELSTGVVSRPRPMMEGAMAMQARVADAAPTPISEGSQTLSATVSARWRFVPGR
jgi:uncharacterized protein YggE